MTNFNITSDGAKAYQAGGKNKGSLLYLRKKKTSSGYTYKVGSTNTPFWTRIKHLFTGFRTHYSYGDKAAKQIKAITDRDPALVDLIHQKLGIVPKPIQEPKKEAALEKEVRTMPDVRDAQAENALLARRIKIQEAEDEKLARRIKIPEEAARGIEVRQPSIEKPAQPKVDETEQLKKKIVALESEISIEKDKLARRAKIAELADLEYKAKAQQLIKDYSHLHAQYKNNPDLAKPLTHSKDINKAVKECVLTAEEQKLAKDLTNFIREFEQVDNFWFTNAQLSEYVRFCQLPQEYPDINFDFILDKRYTQFAELNPGNCLDQLNINDKRNTPIRVHLSGNHWGLIFIDHKKRTVEFYDSFANLDAYKGQGLQESLNRAASRLGSPPYEVVPKIAKKIQRNGYQCGPWSEFAMFYRLANPDADFNQLLPDSQSPMIAHFRNHMVRACLKEELDEAEKMLL